MTSGDSDRGRQISPKPTQVTIRDVARLADTSIATVSIAFSSSKGIAPQTRRRIIEAANQLGWRPDRRASTLRRNRNAVVGVVYEVEQSFQGGLLDSLYISARRHNLEVVLAGATESNSELDCLRLLISERCNAIILTGATLEDSRIEQAARLVPVLSLCRTVDCPGVDVVTTDGVAGSQMAVRHLYDLGHRKIAHLQGLDKSMAAERETGYRSAMNDLGLADQALIFEAGDNLHAGVSTADKILEMRPADRPTGIVAYNDVSAHATVGRLRQKGVRVPEDISVIGFDNAPISRDPVISLTTISQPITDLAGEAMRILAARINGVTPVQTPQDNSDEAVICQLPTTLVLRNTTGPAPR